MDLRSESLEALGLPHTEPLCSAHPDVPLGFVCRVCGLAPFCSTCSAAHDHGGTRAVLDVAEVAAAQRAHLLRLCDRTPAQPGSLPPIDLTGSREATPLPSAPGPAEETPAAPPLAEEQILDLMRALMAEMDALPADVEDARQRALARRDDALAAAAGDDTVAEASAAFDALLEEIAHGSAVRTRDLESDLSVAEAALDSVQSEFGTVRRCICPGALSDADLVAGAYSALLKRVQDTYTALRRLPSLRDDATALIGQLRGDAAVRALLVAGAAKLSRVRSLDLHGLAVSSAGARSLAGTLGAMPHLDALYASKNRMGPEGVATLAGDLRSLQNLVQLWLGHNAAGNAGTAALGVAFASHATPVLTELNLANNRIGDEGGCALARGLPGVPLLRVLRLSSNQLGAEAAEALVAALPALPLLETLELGANRLGAKGTGIIGSALGACAPGLLELDLSDNHADGGKQFFAGLEAGKPIERLASLDFSSNLVSDKSVSSVTGALATHRVPALSKLILAHNNLTARGCFVVIGPLHDMTVVPLLSTLDVSGRRLLQDGRWAPDPRKDVLLPAEVKRLRPKLVLYS